MNRRVLVASILLLSVALVRPEAAPPADAPRGATPAPVTSAAPAGIAAALARVRFEPNRGQFAEPAEYVGRSGSVSLFFGDTDARIRLRDETVRLEWARAGRGADVVAEQQLPGTVSYIRGTDPAAWLTQLPTYAQLRQRNVYAGIDIVYYSHAEGLEFDLVVAPNADLSKAELAIAGAKAVRITAAGDLALTLADGALTIRQPIAYQQGARGQVPVPVRYVQRGATSVGFEADAYDAAKPLVVDPVITYSTLKGTANEDRVYASTTDASGNVLAVIQTNPYAAASTSPYDSYVIKFNPTLSAVLYTVFYGGGVPATCRDRVGGIATDAAENAYLSGGTNCTDFPTTPGAYVAVGLLNDVYHVKLTPAGGVVYSSRFGGAGNDIGFDIAVDAAGNTYSTGSTNSADYPVTVGAYQTVTAGPAADAFVTKLNAAGSARVYSTYLGGTGTDMAASLAVDALGVAHVAVRAESVGLATTPGAHQAAHAGGSDAYVAGLNAAGAALTYATYLGTAGTDNPLSIAVDLGGLPVVTGVTTSAAYPVTPGAFQAAFGGGTEDGFLTKLDALGGLTYSTFLGGSLADRGTGVAVDGTGNMFVAGTTGSVNFPTLNAFQPLAAGNGDAFVVKLSPAGGGAWSSYLGGSLGTDESTGIVVDGSGRVVVGGSTAICNTCVVNDYPTTPGAHQTVSGGGLAGTMVRWDGFLTILLPRQLTLTPAAQTLVTLGSHAVTATLTQDGSPVAGVSIKMTVSGGTSVNGSCLTDALGQCTLSYTGSLLSGLDNIAAYGDGDNDTMADFDEPKAEATITRTYPGGGYGRIEGVVLNQLNYAPIANATVRLIDTSAVPFAAVSGGLAGSGASFDTVTGENGYWGSMVPYGTYKAQTVGVVGYVNELHNNLACEPTCATGPGADIVLAAPYRHDGVNFLLTPMASARLQLVGEGTHAPGGVSSPFVVNVSGPHNLGGILTYSRNGNALVATTILGWSTSGAVTSITGVGTLNGVPGASFMAVFDDSAPKKLRMRILRPVTGAVVVSTVLSPLTTGTFTISLAP